MQNPFLNTTAPATVKEPKRAFNIMEGLESPTTRMMFALQVKSQRDGGHTYEGTVPVAVRDRRRAANKAARRSRAINRKR